MKQTLNRACQVKRFWWQGIIDIIQQWLTVAWQWKQYPCLDTCMRTGGRCIGEHHRRSRSSTGKLSGSAYRLALFIAFLTPTPVKITVYFLSHFSSFLASIYILGVKGLYPKRHLFHISPGPRLLYHVSFFFPISLIWSCGHFSFL